MGMNSTVTTRLASPSQGAARKVVRAAVAGTMHSLPISLRKSQAGWVMGGPLRFCIRATTLRSMPASHSPNRQVNSSPGKMRMLTA